MKLYTDENIMDINFISIINWDYEIMKFYIDFKHYLMEKWNLIWSRNSNGTINEHERRWW